MVRFFSTYLRLSEYQKQQAKEKLPIVLAVVIGAPVFGFWVHWAVGTLFLLVYLAIAIAIWRDVGELDQRHK
jgi:hypothetical protein